MPQIVAETVECHVFRRGPEGAQLLLLHRAAASYMGRTWHPVQGRIEPGETAWQAALRELREETDLRPQRFWQLEFVNTFYRASRDQIYLCPCFAAEVAPDARVRLNAEHTDYRWVSAADVPPALLWPGQRRALCEVVEVIIAGGPAEPFLRIEPLPE